MMLGQHVAKRDARTAWRNIRKFASLPSRQEWYSTASLLSVPMDTDLSANGERMVAKLQTLLEGSNFLRENNVQLIVHSHLIRARRTCRGLFLEAGRRQFMWLSL